MLELSGHDILTSCLIPIGNMLGCLFSDQFLLSKEGVTQGDPLSMMMYGAAILPLIQSLENPYQWIQNWYANDSSCIGKLSSVRQ